MEIVLFSEKMRDFLGTNVTDAVFDSGIFVISEMSMTLSSIGKYTKLSVSFFKSLKVRNKSSDPIIK